MDIRNVVLAALCLLATPATADPISGYVKGDGTAAIPSSLYTVTHRSKGHYKIRFTTPMEPSASCVVTGIGDGGKRGDAFVVSQLSETTTDCTIVFWNPDRGVPSNSAFSFIAVPMSN